MIRIESESLISADAEAQKDLTCAICLAILRRPVQCTGGHLFCCDCIEAHIASVLAQGEESRCPVCRIRIAKSTLSRALFVEKTIRALPVYCRYRFRNRGGASAVVGWVEDLQEGCPDIVSVDTASDHELSCAYRFVSCPHPGCPVEVRANKLANHLLLCDYRPLSCEHCGASIVAKMMKMHWDKDCEMVPIDCDACNQRQLPRRSLGAHNCPEERIPCVLSGCSVLVPRKDMEDHLRDTTGHLMSLAVHLEATQKRFSRMLSLRDERIAVLEEMAKNSREKASIVALQWIIPWSQVQNAGFVRSKSFCPAPGFEFFFGMWPLGDAKSRRNKGYSSYMSVYLFLERRESDYASITVDYSISLVNAVYSTLTVCKVFEGVTFPLADRSSKQQGWGDDEVLLSASVTRDAGFLNAHGHLLFQCMFRVATVSFAI